MININSLSKEYIMGDNKLLALDNIDLSINEGDFVSIMGSSGSGKSTLMKLLSRLYEPEAGKISIDNFDISKVDYLFSFNTQIVVFFITSFFFRPAKYAGPSFVVSAITILPN